jgi:hypothetical protein
MPLVTRTLGGDSRLESAAPEGDGLVIRNGLGQRVAVGGEWRVPLAAWLLSGVSGIMGRDQVAALVGAARRLEKVRGHGRTAALRDAAVLRALSRTLECLVQELLEADPETSTRYEYRPEYYADRQHRLVQAGVLQRVERVVHREEPDDTPAPWEPF